MTPEQALSFALKDLGEAESRLAEDHWGWACRDIGTAANWTMDAWLQDRGLKDQAGGSWLMMRRAFMRQAHSETMREVLRAAFHADDLHAGLFGQPHEEDDGEIVYPPPEPSEGDIRQAIHDTRAAVETLAAELGRTPRL